MSHLLLSWISLEKRDGNKVLSYDVQVLLDDKGNVYGNTFYKKSAVGKVIPGAPIETQFNAIEVNESRQLESHAAKVSHEANAIIDKLRKKGYRVTGVPDVNPVSIIRQLIEHCKKAQAVKEQDSKPEPKGKISAEVVGMVAGVATVAKVLEDFSYQLLGELDNPLRKANRVGDMVKVKASDGKWLLVG